MNVDNIDNIDRDFEDRDDGCDHFRRKITSKGSNSQATESLNSKNRPINNSTLNIQQNDSKSKPNETIIEEIRGQLKSEISKK